MGADEDGHHGGVVVSGMSLLLGCSTISELADRMRAQLEQLELLAADGWHIQSAAENDGDLTVVLVPPREANGDVGGERKEGANNLEEDREASRSRSRSRSQSSSRSRSRSGSRSGSGSEQRSASRSRSRSKSPSRSKSMSRSRSASAQRSSDRGRSGSPEARGRDEGENGKGDADKRRSSRGRDSEERGEGGRSARGGSGDGGRSEGRRDGGDRSRSAGTEREGGKEGGRERERDREREPGRDRDRERLRDRLGGDRDRLKGGVHDDRTAQMLRDRERDARLGIRRAPDAPGPSGSAPLSIASLRESARAPLSLAAGSGRLGRSGSGHMAGSGGLGGLGAGGLNPLPLGAPLGPPGPLPPARCVYVNGLDVRAPEAQVAMLLRREAERYGRVVNMVLHVDRLTDRPRGTAELEFETEAEARSVIRHMAGAMLLGGQLSMHLVEPQLPGPALDPRVPLPPPVPLAPLRPSLKARMSGAGSLAPSGSAAPPGPPFLPPGPPQPTYDAGGPSGRRGLVVGSAEWEMEVRMDRERARLADDRLAAGGGGSGSRKKRRSKGRRKGRGARDERSLRDDDGPEPSGRADEGLTEADKSRSRGRTLRSTIVVEDRKEGDREGDGGGRSRDRERERERDRERDRGGERGASGRGEERGGRDEGRSSRGEDRSGRGEDRRRSGPEDAGRRGRSTSRERARSVGRSRSRDKRQRR